jgi:class 3 adenylate cyclase
MRARLDPERPRLAGVMGFYMDRHDLEAATAADLVVAHLQDLATQERHGVRFLSYWFDYQRKSAFCLVEAPDADAAQAVHRESHGGVANEIIPVDSGEVERFLGRIDDPAGSGRAAESAFRIILFTDLEGSTALAQLLGDDGAVRLLRIHDGIIREALARHVGREVKHTGDGIMASFGSVQAALGGAVDIQRGFADHNASHEPALNVRIGISAGEPVAEGDDLFGAAVQLAARLCDHADPGAIVVSGVVRDLAIGKGFAFGPGGEASLKGFPDPITLCEVTWSTGT